MAEKIFSLNPNDRRFERMGVNRATPDVQAVLSKLVGTGAPRPTTGNGNRVLSTPDDSSLKRLSDATSAQVTDSESLFQMLPDTELSMQILVSTILSPKDMGGNVDLTYTVEAGAMETELVGAMIRVIEEYFDKTYKIKKLLQPILQDSLFMTGSYPLMILPENTIDEAINSPDRVSMESLRSELTDAGHPRAMGFLGPANLDQANRRPVTSLESMYSTPYSPTASMEAMAPLKDKFDPMISVTDNPTLLKLPMLRDKVRQDRIHNLFTIAHRGFGSSVSMESALDAGKPDKTGKPKKEPRRKLVAENTAGAEASLYMRRRYKNVPVMTMVPPEMTGRTPVGHPMVSKLPAESVIPVHVPSNPDEHIGYFVLLDDLGNPVVKAKTADYYTDMATNINSNRDMVSQLIATTKRAERGRETNELNYDKELTLAYADLVEEDLLNRLKNGIYGSDVEISRPTEVYRVMLARSLARMQTRLLYVPAELVTYIAFDYNNMGIGCSLLEKSRILGSMRAITLFANTMAMMKNSMGREVLNITLDPNDKDPTGTVEFLIHEYSKTRQASYPVGASNPQDITRFLQNAGVQVAVSGNTGYPETKFEVEDKASAKTQPNIDLMNELRDQHIMSMGLSPETVTAGANAEFATTIVTQNLLLAKRVLQYQERLCEFLEDFVRKYTLYSGYLMEALREVVRANKSSVAKAEKEARRVAKATAKKPDPDTAPTDQPTGDEGADDGNTDDAAAGDQTDDDVGSFESASNDEGKVGAFDRSKNVNARVLTDADRYSEDDQGDDGIIFEFIKALKISLPAPDTSTSDSQQKAFEQYSQFVELGLKAYVDETFLNDTTLGTMGVKADTVIAVIKSYFLRQWLRTNGVLQELDVLANMGGENEAFDFLEIQEGHMEGLQVSIGRFIGWMEEKLKARGMSTDGGDGGGFGGDTSGGGDLAGGDGGGGASDIPSLDDTGTGGETPAGEQAADDAEIKDGEQETASTLDEDAQGERNDDELDGEGKFKPKSGKDKPDVKDDDVV